MCVCVYINTYLNHFAVYLKHNIVNNYTSFKKKITKDLKEFLFL